MYIKCLITFLLAGSFLRLNAQDKLQSILHDELTREFSVLKNQEIPAYFISYRIDDKSGFDVYTSFGSLIYSNPNRSRGLTITMRVGSPQLDNLHYLRDSYDNTSDAYVELPLDDEPLAIKQALWNATNEAYQNAITRFAKVKANVNVKVEEEDASADFTMEKPNQFYEKPYPQDFKKIDKTKWNNQLQKLSALCLTDSAIFNSFANLSVSVNRKYYISSNGDDIVQNDISSKAEVGGSIKAKDGMEMSLYKSFFAYNLADLSSEKEMTTETSALVRKLIELKNAPLAEPYSGPALLSGDAAGTFFHEIFGHRVEGYRLKRETDDQTFKKKVNELVLPASFTVYCDPSYKNFKGRYLNGYYQYDDEGIKAQRVSLIENGVLKNFLMSRSPIKGFPNSNGHGRAQAGKQPVTRQSNLIIETSQHKTKAELRADFIAKIKEAGKEYGYYFDQVSGGVSNNIRYSANSFNVSPVITYRVYADGRPDQLVRGVNLVGTPLAMFSQINEAGGDYGIFNGMCGSESGWIPVSSLCPELLINLVETQKKAKSQERPYILPRPDYDTTK